MRGSLPAARAPCSQTAKPEGELIDQFATPAILVNRHQGVFYRNKRDISMRAVQGKFTGIVYVELLDGNSGQTASYLIEYSAGVSPLDSSAQLSRPGRHFGAARRAESRRPHEANDAMVDSFIQVHCAAELFGVQTVSLPRQSVSESCRPRVPRPLTAAMAMSGSSPVMNSWPR